MEIFTIFWLFLTFSFGLGFSGDFLYKAAVQIITPGATFPTSSYKIKDCQLKQQYEPGYLSDVGKQQIYLLGRSSRSRFIERGRLLPETFETHSMFVRSADSDRAIATAYSFLTGLYPPGSGPLIEYENVTDHHLKPCYYVSNNFSSYLKEFKTRDALPSRMQPIPVHSKNEKDDYFLPEDWERACPKLGNSVDERQKSKGTKKIKESLSSTVQFINDKYSEGLEGKKMGDEWGRAFSFAKQAFDFENLGCYINDQGYQERIDDIEKLRELDSFFRFPEESKANLSLVITSKILGEVTRFFRAVSDKSRVDDRLKFILFSAEHITLLAMLINLELIHINCTATENYGSRGSCAQFPKPASTLTFELLEEPRSKNLYVSLNYDGQSYAVGCRANGDQLCSLDSFLKLAERKIVNLQTECFIEMPAEEVEPWRWLLFVFLVLGAVSILLLLVLFIVQRKKKWKNLVEEMELKHMNKPNVEN